MFHPWGSWRTPSRAKLEGKAGVGVGGGVGVGSGVNVGVGWSVGMGVGVAVGVCVVVTLRHVSRQPVERADEILTADQKQAEVAD